MKNEDKLYLYFISQGKYVKRLVNRLGSRYTGGGVSESLSQFIDHIVIIIYNDELDFSIVQQNRKTTISHF